jgi:hypothetical protein
VPVRTRSLVVSSVTTFSEVYEVCEILLKKSVKNVGGPRLPTPGQPRVATKNTNAIVLLESPSPITALSN